MKKTLFTCFIVFFTAGLFAQQSTARVIGSMAEEKVFVENKSQFDGANMLHGTKVLYGTGLGNSAIYFTKQGLTYRLYKKERKLENEERENEHSREKKMSEKERAEKEREEHEVKFKLDVVHMQWQNANPNVEVVPMDMADAYQTYGGAKTSIDNVRGYKKLLYKNLYPNIDVEYVFHPQTGIEYSLILHPGADISQVKMNYSSVNKILFDEEGNAHFPTLFGDVVDHAPHTFYADNKNASISSKFVKNGKTISFDLGNYDKTKTVVIDPWSVTPNMGSQDKVWDVECDSFGNVYVFGGDMPIMEKKFNAAGTLQWTYNSPWNIGVQTPDTWIGTLITEPGGVSYVTAGSTGEIAKVTTGGSQVWHDPGNNIREYWSLAFNCDYSTLMIGGMNGGGDGMKVNLNDGTISSTIHVANTTPGFVFPNPDEIRAICHSPNGNYYFLVFDSVGSFTPAMTLNWRTNSTYKIGYAGANYGAPTNQGIHAIAASSTDLYTMNGATLHKRNISNGAIVTTVTIPGGVTSTGFGFTTASNGGLSIDSCGNVYVGSTTGVVKYDANLNFISQTATSGAVYDLEIGKNGVVFAAGDGFVAELNMSACNQVKPICFTTFAANAIPTNLTCGGQCNGTATASTINGTGPFTYHWSGGQTTQTVNNLCAGNYLVTVTDAGSNTATASATVTQPNTMAVNATPSATTCGSANGSATANVTVGISPYTYAWSGGGTSQTVTNKPAGNYSVTATDAGGCTATATVTISSSNGVVANATTTNAGCTPNGTATANISSGTGPFTYLWSSGATTQIAHNLAAGAYVVTVTGAGGCTTTANATVGSNGGAITLNTTTTNAGCAGNGSATALVTAGSGPFTYFWSNAVTTQTASNLGAGTYTVTVTGSGGCSATASATVTSTGGGLTLNATSTNAGCSATGSATVTVTAGTGPYTYAWSNQGNTATISNVGSGTYTVTVTGTGGCSATASAVVSSTGGITVSAVSTPATCTGNNGTAAVSVNTGSGPYTYSWSNNVHTAGISNLSAGTYTVTVTGAGGCSATASSIVTSLGAITLTASSVNTSCGNNNGSATAAPGAGATPYIYAWSNSGNTATISNLPAGTYTVTVTDANGCSATGSAIVNPSGGTTVTITSDKNIMCTGDSAQVCAPAGYATYAWNTGQSTQCIYTKLAGNYYATVTDNGNCTATSNHLAINVHPAPPVSISIIGDTLTAYNSPTYQWFLNGSLIPGATSHVYIAPVSGNYTVEISDSNGCHALSNAAVISVKTGIDEVGPEAGVKVYPNPLETGSWHLEVGEAWLGSKVEIFDDNGRLVYRMEVRNLNSEIDMNVAQGIYLMRIYTDIHSHAQKLLKL